jgi:hypothetical protein
MEPIDDMESFLRFLNMHQALRQSIANASGAGLGGMTSTGLGYTGMGGQETAASYDPVLKGMLAKMAGLVQ